MSLSASAPASIRTGKEPCTRGIGGWLDPRAGLDVLKTIEHTAYDAMLCMSHMKLIGVLFGIETQRNNKVFVTQVVVA